MTVYFTADNHFGHKRILILGKGRPFSSIEEMEETMIKNWNSVVQKGDRIYYLGDFSWSEDQGRIDRILRKLKGEKFLISGNHDSKAVIRSSYWSQVWQYRELKIEGQKIILCHYPFEEWNGSWRNSWHLHGHCHGNLPVRQDLKRLDIGVDCYDFTPISFEHVKSIMSQKLERVSSHD